MKRLSILILLVGCDGVSTKTSVAVQNQLATATTVYVSFGADSKIKADDWSFCTGSNLACSFNLGAKTTKVLPTDAYLDATFSFDAPVGCGVTKAEINVNNPAWYDILDVSLVDGYSNAIQISVEEPPHHAWVFSDTTPTVTIWPVKSATGNEKAFGVFPYGCDICVERKNPPCGISKGTEGCKRGTQYDPAVPCQWQGPTKGGGGHVTISLVSG